MQGTSNVSNNNDIIIMIAHTHTTHEINNQMWQKKTKVCAQQKQQKQKKKTKLKVKLERKMLNEL